MNLLLMLLLLYIGVSSPQSCPELFRALVLNPRSCIHRDSPGKNGGLPSPSSQGMFLISNNIFSSKILLPFLGSDTNAVFLIFPMVLYKETC